ncbi:hypothetical protein DdX_12298 [Ditylenchus destructor]|uniref:Uncharacterized protein n=1 Tax=Ditylenchus destructor TaxID=166010 RepID=A0AAD4R3V6_9BILA|nr:hypothetical protein DdX_12298 [Ditylenchus destructor]
MMFDRIQLSCWLQYFCLKKVSAFGVRALSHQQKVLPFMIIAAVISNFANFLINIRHWELTALIKEDDDSTKTILCF